eukprot:Partr_v1_DN26089_c2_g2_i1_m744 putative KIN, antigenic determinant of recA protein homolog (Mouse)
MPKHDFFSPKAIGNRIKAKGLQKLRWYCQVCQKQCRDENGYKSHIASEPHQRKILIFGESASKQIDQFSRQFREGYLSILSRRYKNGFVSANQVYQEYIADRDHIHMNATKWATLAEFVGGLGKAGVVRVEEGERGFMIEWIDDSPRERERQRLIDDQERQRKDQDERDRLMIAEQVERGRLTNKVDAVPDEMKELRRDGDSKPISISFASSSSSSSKKLKVFKGVQPVAIGKKRPRVAEGFGDDSDGASDGASSKVVK